MLVGDVAAEFVVREGSHNRVAKYYAAGTEIEDTFVFEAERAGDIYILVRLAGGEGEFLCHSIGYTPFNEEILHKADLEHDAVLCNIGELEPKRDGVNE